MGDSVWERTTVALATRSAEVDEGAPFEMRDLGQLDHFGLGGGTNCASRSSFHSLLNSSS